MKIRLDEKEGLAADTAIEIDGKESRTPSSVVTVGILEWRTICVRRV